MASDSVRHHSHQRNPSSMNEVHKCIDHLMSVMAEVFDLPWHNQHQESNGQSTAKYQSSTNMVQEDQRNESQRTNDTW